MQITSMQPRIAFGRLLPDKKGMTVQTRRITKGWHMLYDALQQLKEKNPTFNLIDFYRTGKLPENISPESRQKIARLQARQQQDIAGLEQKSGWLLRLLDSLMLSIHNRLAQEQYQVVSWKRSLTFKKNNPVRIAQRMRAKAVSSRPPL